MILLLKLILKLILIFSISIPSFALRRVDTKRFRIVYDESFAEQVAWLRDNVDKIYEEKAKKLGVEHHKHLITLNILRGEVEDGSVNYFSDSLVSLSPNELRFFNNNHHNFLRMIFTHELIHLLLVSKSPIKMGRGSVTGPIPPSWFHEGLAVFEEGGRGYHRFFKNIGNSMGNPLFRDFLLSLKHRYNLGFSFLQFCYDKFGHEKFYEIVQRRARTIYFSTLFMFGDVETMEEWSNSFEKKKTLGELATPRNHIIGRLFSSNGKKLSYIHNYAGETVVRGEGPLLIELEDSGCRERLLHSRVIDLSYYGDERIFVTKMPKSTFLTSLIFETALYVDGKNVEAISPRNAIKISDDEILYTSRVGGKEAIISSKRGMLLDYKEDYTILRIFHYNGDDYFLGKEYYGNNIGVYKIEKNNLIKLFSAISASQYEDKLYFIMDEEKETAIYEYSFNNSKVKYLEGANSIIGINRLGDNLLLLQPSDDGLPKLYKFPYKDSKNIGKEISPEIFKREIKNREIEKGRAYVARFFPDIPGVSGSISNGALELEISQPFSSDTNYLKITPYLKMSFNDPIFKLFSYQSFGVRFNISNMLNIDIEHSQTRVAIETIGKIRIERRIRSRNTSLKRIELHLSNYIKELRATTNFLIRFDNPFLWHHADNSIDYSKLRILILLGLSFDKWNHRLRIEPSEKFNKILFRYETSLYRTTVSIATLYSTKNNSLAKGLSGFSIVNNTGFQDDIISFIQNSTTPLGLYLPKYMNIFLGISQTFIDHNFSFNLANREAMIGISGIYFNLRGHMIFAKIFNNAQSIRDILSQIHRQNRPSFGITSEIGINFIHFFHYASRVRAQLGFIEGYFLYQIGFNLLF